LQEIADTLNAMGVPTARGGKWAAMTVLRVQRRVDAMRDHDATDEFDGPE